MSPSGKGSPFKRVWSPWRRFAGTTSAGITVLNQDFREFIASLDASGVRYLVVGGYAVALHGHPRYTKHFDVWLEATAENAAREIEALETFGFGFLGLEPEDFQASDQVVQLGYPPNRIDLWTSLTGVEFTDCYPSRVAVEVDGVQVDFIDLDSLKKNKLAVGRNQDLADLENLN